MNSFATIDGTNGHSALLVPSTSSPISVSQCRIILAVQRLSKSANKKTTWFTAFPFQLFNHRSPSVDWSTKKKSKLPDDNLITHAPPLINFDHIRSVTNPPPSLLLARWSLTVNVSVSYLLLMIDLDRGLPVSSGAADARKASAILIWRAKTTQPTKIVTRDESRRRLEETTTKNSKRCCCCDGVVAFGYC